MFFFFFLFFANPFHTTLYAKDCMPLQFSCYKKPKDPPDSLLS